MKDCLDSRNLDSCQTYYLDSIAEACGCVESVDMGIYNTCQFRCSYCYAKYNEGIIDKNRSKHDVNDPAMLGQHERTIEIQDALQKKKKKNNQNNKTFFQLYQNRGYFYVNQQSHSGW